MNLNHLHDSFFTDISLLILYDVYVTFAKIEKNIQFWKKTFFRKISRLACFEQIHRNLISRIANFRKFREKLISRI